jgi:putative endonuclease
MAVHNELGKRGEGIAREYLENAGYRILNVNWKYARAEVDVIADQGVKLIFGELKPRTSTDYGTPEDFVDRKK